MDYPENLFLRSLKLGDFQLLRPHLLKIALPMGQVLFNQGDMIERIYFPYSGVVSLVVVLADGDAVEAGLIGHDGAIGIPAALDGAKSLNRALVQMAGEAMVIDAEHAKAAVAASRTLREAFYQADQLLLAQAQQSVACNAKHPIRQRMARWILRTRDAARSDTLDLTQEFVAQMLGVRRTSVTLEAQELQKLGLIKYRRGNIEIIDPEGLKQSACECYTAVKARASEIFPGSKLRK